MSETITIASGFRQQTGKSAVKKLHADNKIPAVVYGHHFPALALELPAPEMNKLFRLGSAMASDFTLFRLTIDGHPEQKETIVMIKDIQRDPLKSKIQHIDFFAVDMNEEITAPVTIRLQGSPVGVKEGGILRQILREIMVKSLPGNIPSHLDIAVSALNVGDSVHVSQLTLPENVQVLLDPETAIANVMSPTVHEEEEEEAEGVEGEEGAETAAGAADEGAADAGDSE